MKITISSGHGKFVSGASGYLNEVEEARRVTDRVAKHLEQLGCLSEKFHENTAKNKTDNLNNIIKFHNTTNRDLDFSVHFNAHSTTSKDMGVEVCYLDSSMKSLADKLCTEICSVSKLKYRGAKKRTNLGFLNYTKKPALLIEVCFVDSKADMEKYEKNFDAICKSIAETLTGKKLQQEKEVNAKRCTVSVRFTDTSKNLKAYKELLAELGLKYECTQGVSTETVKVPFAEKSTRYGAVVEWLKDKKISYDVE